MNNGMLYKRHSFTVPASETRETDVCELDGFHIASGPAKMRNCLRCGVWLPKGATGTVPFLASKPCDRECAFTEPYGWAPEADCPVHDPATISTLSETYKQGTMKPGDLGEGTDEELRDVMEGGDIVGLLRERERQLKK